MQEWEYDELKEYIEEVFNNSINDGLTVLQAGGRCLYEFSNVVDEGELEKIVFYMNLAHLQIEHGVLSQRIYEEVATIMKDFDPSNFANGLDMDDAHHFNELVKDVQAKLARVEIIG